MLNRDTWSDDTVQSVVASAFVFWQNYAESEGGSRYCTLYHIPPDKLPHIGILDPRTGEKLVDITGFIEPQELILKCTSLMVCGPSCLRCDFVVSDFCGNYSLQDTGSRSRASTGASAGGSSRSVCIVVLFLQSQRLTITNNSGRSWTNPKKSSSKQPLQRRLKGLLAKMRMS